MRPGDIIISTVLSFSEWRYWWWGLFVLFFTKSKWSHASLYIGDGQVVEAIAGSVVRIAPVPEHHIVLRLPGLTDYDREVLVRWARTRVGKPYNWSQFAVASFKKLGLVRNCFRSTKSYICSALVAEAYHFIGKPLSSSVVMAPAEIAECPRLVRVW